MSLSSGFSLQVSIKAVLPRHFGWTKAGSEQNPTSVTDCSVRSRKKPKICLHVVLILHVSLLFPSLQPQCGAFLSWVWQWSMPSPSLESSSRLWWRHAIWNTYSAFSSLLPLAHCSPLRSCSCCQRFAFSPYVFHFIYPEPCFSNTQSTKVHCGVTYHTLFTEPVHVWPRASSSSRGCISFLPAFVCSLWFSRALIRCVSGGRFSGLRGPHCITDHPAVIRVYVCVWSCLHLSQHLRCRPTYEVLISAQLCALSLQLVEQLSRLINSVSLTLFCFFFLLWAS